MSQSEYEVDCERRRRQRADLVSDMLSQLTTRQLLIMGDDLRGELAVAEHGVVTVTKDIYQPRWNSVDKG